MRALFLALLFSAVATAGRSRVVEVPRERLMDGDMTQPLGTLPLPQARLFPEIVFVNGFDTSASQAIFQAEATGTALKSGTRLIFNDLTAPFVDDLAILFEKLYKGTTSLNAAGPTLYRFLKTSVERGDEVYLIGYSAGTLVVANALNHLHHKWRKDRERRQARFRRIHVLNVASAVFEQEHLLADGWPEGLGSLSFLHFRDDPVVQYVGPGRWGPSDFLRHDYLKEYLPHVEAFMLKRSTTKVLP